MRSVFQKGLSSPQNVRQFLPRADEVTKEFLDSFTGRLIDGVAKDMVKEFEKFNLELTYLMAFDDRLNSFSDNECQPNSISSKIIEASDFVTSSVSLLDQGFMMWRFFDTKLYKKNKKFMKLLEDVAVDLVERRIKENRIDGNSLLDQYLRNPNADKKDIIGTSIDLMLGGIHTSAYTEGAALYYISKNKQVQDLMYEEAKKVLPNVYDEITPKILNTEIPYIRAVLKETFRLNPISVGIGRILNHDTIFSGYLVPKNVSFN